jgi:hypothetical protein
MGYRSVRTEWPSGFCIGMKQMRGANRDAVTAPIHGSASVVNWRLCCARWCLDTTAALARAQSKSVMGLVELRTRSLRWVLITAPRPNIRSPYLSDTSCRGLGSPPEYRSAVESPVRPGHKESMRGMRARVCVMIEHTFTGKSPINIAGDDVARLVLIMKGEKKYLSQHLLRDNGSLTMHNRGVDAEDSVPSNSHRPKNQR